jgi:hypothetical protein
LGLVKAISHWRNLAWQRFEPSTPKWHTDALSTTPRAHAQPFYKASYGWRRRYLLDFVYFFITFLQSHSGFPTFLFLSEVGFSRQALHAGSKFPSKPMKCNQSEKLSPYILNTGCPIWRVLQWKMSVYSYYGHLVYFMTIWHTFPSFGIVSPFW